LKALILAAGEGKRIRVIGDSKPLVSLLGLRLIERAILTAKKSGIKDNWIAYEDACVYTIVIC